MNENFNKLGYFAQETFRAGLVLFVGWVEGFSPQTMEEKWDLAEFGKMVSPQTLEQVL